MGTYRNLLDGFLKSVELFPQRPAAYVNGKFYTYTQLYEKALQISSAIVQNSSLSAPKLTAVFANRNITAYSAIIGTLLAGNGYVPLNCTFEIDRVKIMLKDSGCRSIVADTESIPQLCKILENYHDHYLIIFPEIATPPEFFNKKNNFTVLCANELLSINQLDTNLNRNSSSIAYILFTSGTTGKPKGVQINHTNVISFINYIVNRYSINENDRLSQMFDLTFDLSVFDLFVSWEKGACVCCPSNMEAIKPGKFIKELNLTIWFSVPSTVLFMKRFGLLKLNSYPSLRLSLFCGEALPVSLVCNWVEAAPNSIIENLYGPTELTIACSVYRWDNKTSLEESLQGIVPIGHPFPDMKTLIVDNELHEIEDGKEGELLVTGPQMSIGYINDIDKTSHAFIKPPEKNELYYKTGDRVKRSISNGFLHYLGRVDYQIKIQGRRVELFEIEAVIREETNLDGIVAMGWPITMSGAAAIEVFIEGKYDDLETLRNKISHRLPNYMMPARFHCIDKIPLNVNGKYDRNALQKILKEKV